MAMLTEFHRQQEVWPVEARPRGTPRGPPSSITPALSAAHSGGWLSIPIQHKQQQQKAGDQVFSYSYIIPCPYQLACIICQIGSNIIPEF
jgi:hypothetical protein